MLINTTCTQRRKQFIKIKKMKPSEEFEKETGVKPVNSQGEPDIDYVSWLEKKIELCNNRGSLINKEYVLCAAIWYKELHLVKPEALRNRGILPYNVDKGIVFSGWRHANCIYQKVAMTGLRDAESGENTQGFLTNLNRFVDRKERLIESRLTTNK